MTEPGIDDPFLAALAEWWAEVLALAGDAERARLVELVTGTQPADPVDVRAELAEILIVLLPEEHPLLPVIGGALLYDPGVDTRPDVTSDLRRLAEYVRRGGTIAAGPAGGPDPRPADRDWFDRQVEARLLALPAVAAEEVLGGTDGLVGLPGPGRTVRIPGFQLDGRRPRPVVREVNGLLGAADDPWGVACWWVDVHAALDARPADLLGRDQDRLLLAAARATLEDF